MTIIIRLFAALILQSIAFGAPTPEGSISGLASRQGTGAIKPLILPPPEGGTFLKFSGNAADPISAVEIELSDVQELTGTLLDLDDAITGIDARLEDVEEDTSSFVGGGVILHRDGMSDSYYNPVEASDAGRGTALQTALITANLTPEVKAQVTLINGRFAIPAGEPLSEANPAGNTTVTFGDGAAVVYADPEDATLDSGFYEGPRNVLNFGARPRGTGGDDLAQTGGAAASMPDCWSYFQAASNSLKPYYDGPYYLVSGRELRIGEVIIPVGDYGFSQEWQISPTVHITGAGSSATRLFLLDGSFNDEEGGERFMVRYEMPESVDVNNLFYSKIKGLAIVCRTPAQNLYGSGLQILGGQGTLAEDVRVTMFRLRGVYTLGCNFERLWVSEIYRGPGLHWTGGGTADVLSVEHNNPDGIVDPSTSEVYPSVYMQSGYFTAGQIFGEEGGSNPQTVVRMKDVLTATIGNIGMGVETSGRAHTILRVTGNAQGVTVGRIAGSSGGYGLMDVGTLVLDDSQSSPAGSGVAYTLSEARGTYAQNQGPLSIGHIGIGVPPSATYAMDVSSASTGIAGFRTTNTSAGTAAQVQHQVRNNSGAVGYWGISSSTFTTFAPLTGGRAFFGSYLTPLSVFTQDAQPITFYTTAVDRGRITAGGNFLMGTAVDNGAKLQVSGTVTASGFVKLGSYTVAALPAAATAGTGAQAIVTDSLAPAISSPVASGGAAKAVVTSNGTAWIVTATL